MLQLRPLTVIALALVSGGFGAACTAYKYEQKVLRITEEREGYMALAEKALATSDRALTFALGYQEVLEVCMTRLYSSPTTASPVIAVKRGPVKGGLGGPNPVRGNSRLP